MEITRAASGEYESVRGVYHSLMDALEGSAYHPMWQKDLYPAPEALQSAIEAGDAGAEGIYGHPYAGGAQ